MKRSNNIMWWDYKIPRLENWLRPDKSSLSGPDQVLLNNTAMDSGFHSELLPFITNENIVTINAISSETNLKIQAGLKSPYRLITIGSISLLMVAALMYVFYGTGQPESLYQQRPGAVAQTFADGPDFEIPSIATHLSMEEPKSTEEAVANSETHSRTVPISTPATPSTDISGKEKKVVETETDEKIVKRSKPVTGMKIADGQIKTKESRDPRQPMSLQRVDIARKENYWVYLNNSNDISYAPTDMPQYSGGDSRLTDDIAYYIRQTGLNERYDEPVSVLVSFVVNSKGKMEDIEIKHSSTGEIESSVRNALNKLELWQRGHKMGKKGSMYYEIAISFN